MGHFAYYGITGNSNALGRFRNAATWHLEALAVTSATARWPDVLGPTQSLSEALSAPASDRGPLGVPSRSEHVT